MLGWLRGTIRYLSSRHIILDIGGVGYEVWVPTRLSGSFLPDSTAEFFIHHIIREDANLLYGFPTSGELELFKLLLTVSGVGPKTALSVLDGAEPLDIIRALGQEDASFFKNISGIGAKTSERIILELKGKVEKMSASSLGGESSMAYQNQEDIISALVALGYQAVSVRRIVRELGPVASAQEGIRRALAKLK
ncbi:MAG: holliday junction DNA helicase RuvA [Parcubacteria group bacterium Gr01-1014_18]|nr:MAG: holliday junction DNA helicase RuvA [Parcubacteria group bacterium Greene0416_36]TSC81370.1 MAG: holliday junction DNA helicase RuvA [Parcubacteria group bacterium Gr01-1014_18]TSC99444.1 MAG: holliday junction DNA helicase RuvA [Parcubacteria group bacterium Greene1014_20]TSD07637.1 MAG: holliday junction DNA helicase RuvA [Parcubacteria group bacterium Greene0714_2]